MNNVTQKRKLKKYMIAYGLCFLLLLSVFCVVNLLTPDRTLSASEKRTLAGFPALNTGRILDGSFSADFEEYASDQIPARDFFIRLRSGFSLLLGSRESQGVFYAKDGYLMERMEAVDETALSKTLHAICTFSENAGIPSTLVLVPNAVSIHKDLLPAFAVTEDQNNRMDWIGSQLSDSVSFCNLTEPLSEMAANGGQVYYRTDHHWTSAAAYTCFPSVADALGITPSVTYSPLLVSDSFSGSLAAKSGYPVRVYDKIYVYAPETETPYIVTDNTAHTKSATIYSSEALSGTDPYTVFLGGNASHLTIQTANSDGGRLLVFKDSYFNCFLPFLIPEYAEIDIIDPRYYYDDIQMLLYEKNYDAILYFYNLNTFTEDTSLMLTLGDDE